MICVKTRRDGISNETIWNMIGMKKIEEFLVEQRLQWFGHVKKMMDKERVPVKARNFFV